MTAIFPILAGIAAFATLGVLAFGMINMFRPNHDPHQSNKLMAMRVTFQAIAILMFVLFMLFAQK